MASNAKPGTMIDYQRVVLDPRRIPAAAIGEVLALLLGDRVLVARTPMYDDSEPMTHYQLLPRDEAIRLARIYESS